MFCRVLKVPGIIVNYATLKKADKYYSWKTLFSIQQFAKDQVSE